MDTNIHTFSVSRGLSCTLILALGERKCRKIYKVLLSDASNAREMKRYATEAQMLNEAALLMHICHNLGWKVQ